jgi:tetratricopeptide (TPR) repeat protein
MIHRAAGFASGGLAVNRKSWFVLLLLISASLAVGQTRDQNWKKCSGDDAQSSIEGCTALIQSGQESNANTAIAYANRGNDYNKLHQYGKAIPDLTESLRLNPNNAHALNWRGRSYEHTDQPDLAIADDDAALRLDPNLAVAFNDRGIVYDDKAQYDRAIQDYNDAIRIKPDLDIAWYNRGLAYSHKKDYARALPEFERYIEMAPSDPDGFYKRGSMRRLLGHCDLATPDYDHTLLLDPDYPMAYFDRGMCRAEKGAYGPAIEDYTSYIRLKPSDADGFNNRGSAYNSTAQYDRAIEDFSQAIRLDPKHAFAHYNRGLAYRHKNQQREAIADFDTYIGLAPDDWDGYRQKGGSHDMLEEYDKAIAAYTQGSERTTQKAVALELRCDSYRRKGDYTTAIQDCSRSLELDSNSYSAQFSRGLARYLNGQTAEAASDFRRSFELRKYDYSLLWLHLAEQRLGHDDSDEFNRDAATLNLTDWPGPVVEYFQHKRSFTQLTDAAKNTDDEKDKGQKCEAYFYMGDDALTGSQRIMASAWLLAARQSCPHNFFEYEGAVVESGRLLQF